MGADSPLLARPRAGSFGRDLRIKRHRGDDRTQHENASLVQELAPVFHQSFSSSSATDDNLHLPLAGAGRARQLARPQGTGARARVIPNFMYERFSPNTPARVAPEQRRAALAAQGYRAQ